MPARKKKTKTVKRAAAPADGEMQTMPRLVTVREFAQEIQSSPEVIYKYIKQGILAFTYSSGKRFVDLEKGKRALIDCGKHSGTRGMKMEPDPAKVGELDPLGDAIESEVPTAGMTYAQAKAYRESFTARQKELDFNIKRGTLIERDEVEKAAFEAARITRENILNVPDRIAADLAAEDDPTRVRVMLQEALVQALAGLSDKNIFAPKPAPLVAPQAEEENAFNP